MKIDKQCDTCAYYVVRGRTFHKDGSVSIPFGNEGQCSHGYKTGPINGGSMGFGASTCSDYCVCGELARIQAEYENKKMKEELEEERRKIEAENDRLKNQNDDYVSSYESSLYESSSNLDGYYESSHSSKTVEDLIEDAARLGKKFLDQDMDGFIKETKDKFKMLRSNDLSRKDLSLSGYEVMFNAIDEVVEQINDVASSDELTAELNNIPSIVKKIKDKRLVIEDIFYEEAMIYEEAGLPIVAFRLLEAIPNNSKTKKIISKISKEKNEYALSLAQSYYDEEKYEDCLGILNIIDDKESIIDYYKEVESLYISQILENKQKYLSKTKKEEIEEDMKELDKYRVKYPKIRELYDELEKKVFDIDAQEKENERRKEKYKEACDLSNTSSFESWASAYKIFGDLDDFGDSRKQKSIVKSKIDTYANKFKIFKILGFIVLFFGVFFFIMGFVAFANISAADANGSFSDYEKALETWGGLKTAGPLLGFFCIVGGIVLIIVGSVKRKNIYSRIR